MKESRAPFVVVSQKLVMDKGIKASSKVVYMVLCKFADNETQEAFPSRKTIRSITGISDSTLTRSLGELEDGGYIRVEPRFKRDYEGNITNEKTSNKYHILNT